MADSTNMVYGKGVQISIKGNTLTITVDMSKDFGLSKAGKSRIVATTSGNKPLPNGAFLGLNVYKLV